MASPEIGLSPTITGTLVPQDRQIPFNSNGIKGSIPVHETYTDWGGGVSGSFTYPFPLNRWLSIPATASVGVAKGGSYTSTFWSACAGLRISATPKFHVDVQGGYSGFTAETLHNGGMVAVGVLGTLWKNMGLGIRAEGVFTSGSMQERTQVMASWSFGETAPSLHNPEAPLRAAETIIRNMKQLFGNNTKALFPLSPDESDYIVQFGSFYAWINGTGELFLGELPNLNTAIDDTRAMLDLAASLVVSEDPSLQSRLSAAQQDLATIKSQIAKISLTLLLGPQKSSLSRILAKGKEILATLNTKKPQSVEEDLSYYGTAISTLASMSDRLITFLTPKDKEEFQTAISTLDCLNSGDNCPKEVDTNLTVPALKQKAMKR